MVLKLDILAFPLRSHVFWWDKVNFKILGRQNGDHRGHKVMVWFSGDFTKTITIILSLFSCLWCLLCVNSISCNLNLYLCKILYKKSFHRLYFGLPICHSKVTQVFCVTPFMVWQYLIINIAVKQILFECHKRRSNGGSSRGRCKETKETKPSTDPKQQKIKRNRWGRKEKKTINESRKGTTKEYMKVFNHFR